MALMLTVGLILAIACVNVANLLIARGVGRRREVAVRYAIGATRGRVYTSLITESVVLALMASAVGLCLAIWIKGLLVGAAPLSTPRLGDVAIGWRAVGFTLVLSVITGVIFGGLPAWQAGTANPIDAMSSGGRVVAGRRVMRWRNGLMAAQLALSVLLLVGAGLMLKSLAKLNSVELGFDTKGVVTLRTTLPVAKYPTAEARLDFFARVEERLKALPGVETVGFANAFPMRGGWGSGFQIEGVQGPAETEGYFMADFQAVSPGYFKALGIPLLRGRALEASDKTGSMPVAVVSEAFERKLLKGESALGKRFNRGGPYGAPITVVGVVRDVRRDGRIYTIEPQVYLPAAQTQIYPVRLQEIAVRAAKGDGHDLVPAIRSAVWAVDAEQPIQNLRTLDEILIADAAARRFQTLLFTIFAVLALVLASIGTYGVIAYLVSQRTPEIGVRMALGAIRGRIYTWLMGRTLLLAAAGTLVGLVVARGTATSIEALLFEVTPGDPMTYAIAAAALMGVATGACALAVRRAARIDPTAALRCE
jgi:predicted permease